MSSKHHKTMTANTYGWSAQIETKSMARRTVAAGSLIGVILLTGYVLFVVSKDFAVLMRSMPGRGQKSKVGQEAYS